jgi:benzoylformate decarboxylase
VDDASIAAWTPVGISIVTQLRVGVRALLNGPAPAPRRAPGLLQRPAPLSGGPLTDRFLLQEIAALRPKGSVVVEEAPSSRGPMHDYLPITERDGFYTCASGGLGHGLPAAIGVALARPEAKVIAFLGDGSSMYSIQGLWSAAQLGLKMAFIIVKNGRYEALHEFGRRFDLPQLPGTALPELDFCKLAESQGVRALHVGRAADLAGALKEAFRFQESILVEVVVECGEGSA